MRGTPSVSAGTPRPARQGAASVNFSAAADTTYARAPDFHGVQLQPTRHPSPPPAHPAAATRTVQKARPAPARLALLRSHARNLAPQPLRVLATTGRRLQKQAFNSLGCLLAQKVLLGKAGRTREVRSPVGLGNNNWRWKTKG